MRAHPLMIAMATCVLAFAPAIATAQTPRVNPTPEHRTMPSQTLTERQQAILPIAAFTASGDMPKLDAALNAGLDAGLTINEIKEIQGQLYAYVGFPRSLNGLGQLMKVLDARKARGVDDPTKDHVGTCRVVGHRPTAHQLGGLIQQPHRVRPALVLRGRVDRLGRE